MAYTLKDRVLVTSTSTGTGDFVLGAAQTGYQAFTVVGNGASIPYTIQGRNPDGTLTSEWEVGIGTYHSSGNYISRDTVLESSNSNAKVSFSAGDKDVFLDLPGELIVQGPNSATASDFVAFDGTSGKVIKDSGFSSASFATAAQGAKADTAVQPGDLGTAAYLDAGVANGVATLDAGGKVPTSQIPQMGDLNYQGTWNAATNTPTLTSGVGTKGYYYVVNVAGTTNLDGITDWFVGDWAVFNGTVWEQIDNTDAVTSVNGYTGAVTLTYTDVGAQPAGTYVTSVSGTAPVVSSGGTTPAISMHVADATNDGYLSSTDWNTFNSKGTGDVVGPSSATDNAIARFDTTTGKLIQNSVGILSDTGALSGITNITNINYVDFDTTYATTLTEGQLGWDGNNTLGLGMAGGNVIQHIGEDQFFYCKATSSITKGQVVMFTGAVGASGVPTGAPATGITDGTYIMGIAAESIATNGFGLVQSFGTLRNVNTSGYADGDILWYNPSVTGGLTNVKPSAPNVKAQMAAVINGGSSGGGTILIRINPGSTLGGTDSNAQINGGSNGQIISYDGGNGYYTNTTLTAGTAISVTSSVNGVLTIANTAPDQVVSLTGAGTTTVTGTYPNFTITSNDAYVGTVTSVSGTGTVNGITLSGTVTSSGSLTLGGTLDLSSPPTIGNTTPNTGSFTTLIGGADVANYGQLTGGATTKAIEWKSLGSDTNVAFAIRSKGTGAIDLAAGSGGVNISNGGTVTAITRTASGSGYTSFPSVAITAPTTAGGVQATASVSNMFANTATIAGGGTGYTLNDVITLVGGTVSGSAATYTVTGVSAGAITSVTPLNFGTYTVLPSNPVSVTGGTGSGATLTVTWGVSNAFTITNAGSGYIEQPTVTFSGGGGSGAAAYATVGSGTIVKSIGSSMLLQTPGGTAFGVTDIANAVNYIRNQGSATGFQVFSTVQGTDTNTSYALTSKGNGAVSLYTNLGNQLQFTVAHTASAVNYVQVTGAVTTGIPLILAQGSDTNVSVALASKAGGYVSFRTNTSVEQMRVYNTASAVNRIEMTGSATGSAPLIAVAGNDTNIDLALTPKGTGVVRANGVALSAENGIILNKQTVATGMTIATGYSAMSAGPITVASGQTVTVSSGSKWVIL